MQGLLAGDTGGPGGAADHAEGPTLLEATHTMAGMADAHGLIAPAARPAR